MDFVQLHLSDRVDAIYEDNEGAKALAENLRVPDCSEYIDVRFHFLQAPVRLGQVTTHSEASADQHADILTKPLEREAFRRHRNSLTNPS